MTPWQVDWRGRFVRLAASSLWLTSACAARPANTPLPQATPTCQLQPQPTGEKYVGPTVAASPPAQVFAEQTITIVLSGAYGVVGNNAIVCSGDVVDYAFSDALPTFNWKRTVEVRLDGRTLTVIECADPCRIEIVVPAQMPPGTHELSLVTARLVEPVTFEIEIVAP